MISGEYKISQGGEVIDVVKNVITTNGKKQLLQYIGKLREGWADTMLFGAGTTAAVIGDNWMGQTIYECPVYISKVDTTAGTITLKAQIDTDAQFRFREIGMRPANIFSGYPDAVGEKISNCSSDDSWTFASTATKFISRNDTTSFAGSTYGALVKDSSEAIYVATTTPPTLTKNLDLGKYPTSSQIVIGAVNSVASEVATIRFYVGGSTSKYFSYAITFPGTTGYQRIKLTQSSFTANGGAVTSDWSDITSVWYNPGSAQILDTIRIDREDTSILSDTLFSRAVLGSEVTKSAGLPLDIEYTVTIGLA
jgi:hypothetical protein